MLSSLVEGEYDYLPWVPGAYQLDGSYGQSPYPYDYTYDDLFVGPLAPIAQL